MVCDLYDRTGIPVPFFGKPARTQAIGAMIDAIDARVDAMIRPNPASPCP